MNYDVNVYFPENKIEVEKLNQFLDYSYFANFNELDDTNKIKQENFSDSYWDNLYSNIDFFSDKYDDKIDKYFTVNLFRYLINEEEGWITASSELNILWDGYNSKKETRSVGMSYRTINDNEAFDNIPDDNIEEKLLDRVYRQILELRYGDNIGKISKVLDKDFVIIKLNNESIIKGTLLRVNSRVYFFRKQL